MSGFIPPLNVFSLFLICCNITETSKQHLNVSAAGYRLVLSRTWNICWGSSCYTHTHTHTSDVAVNHLPLWHTAWDKTSSCVPTSVGWGRDQTETWTLWDKQGGFKEADLQKEEPPCLTSCLGLAETRRQWTKLSLIYQSLSSVTTVNRRKPGSQ